MQIFATAMLLSWRVPCIRLHYSYIPLHYPYINQTATNLQLIEAATCSVTLQTDQSLLQQLEAVCEEAVGIPDWAAALDSDVVANLGKYRKYNSRSLRDLLRVMRNKHNHFREMPLSLQQKLGPLPEGFLR